MTPYHRHDRWKCWPQAYTQSSRSERKGHENLRAGPEIFTRGKKRGNILVENIIFIILNLVFLSILILFLVKQGSGAIVLEQSYTKQIALLIDSAKPGMILKLNMEEGKKLADKNKVNFDEIVKIEKNIVIVKLSEKGGYEYSFFNDVDVTAYPDKEFYVFIINEKN